MKPSVWWPAHPVGQVFLLATLTLAWLAGSLQQLPDRPIFNVWEGRNVIVAWFEPITGVICGTIWYFLIVGIRTIWFSAISSRKPVGIV